jgi:hypothetical protein
MNGLRDVFTLYALAVATVGFVAVIHLATLLGISPPFFAGDRLPRQSLVMNATPIERHSAGVQNPNTLAKPVQLK